MKTIKLINMAALVISCCFISFNISAQNSFIENPVSRSNCSVAVESMVIVTPDVSDLDKAYNRVYYAFEKKQPEAAIDIAPQELEQEVRKQVVLKLISQNEYTRAITQWNLLNDLDKNETIFGKYTQVLFDINRQGIAKNKLPFSMIQELYNIIQNDTEGLYSVYAKAILELNNTKQLARPIAMPNNSKNEVDDNKFIKSSDGSIIIYPNPAKDAIKVKADGVIKQLVLTNSMGEQVQLFGLILNSSEATLDVKNYSDGLYFISVLLSDGTYKNSKFIIAR